MTITTGARCAPLSLWLLGISVVFEIRDGHDRHAERRDENAIAHVDPAPVPVEPGTLAGHINFSVSDVGLNLRLELGEPPISLGAVDTLRDDGTRARLDVMRPA